MRKLKKKDWLIFFSAVAVTLIILPLLRQLGLPGFDDLFAWLFG
ncbi:hypothetical protein ADIAL_2127 [Alkalibacterium sp. AK22]|nr:hypothetical protein [Alkalibacterium sp. AK22]EXJ22541.1 hypothetical protein ADIAL_2127 [Alkalibacterium sp. AK22]